MFDYDVTHIVDEWERLNAEADPEEVAYPRTITCRCIACGQDKPVTFKTAGEVEDFVDGHSCEDFVCQDCEDVLERSRIERYEAGLP